MIYGIYHATQYDRGSNYDYKCKRIKQKLEPMILPGVVYLFKFCVNVFCYYITNQKIIIPKWKEIPNL